MEGRFSERRSSIPSIVVRYENRAGGRRLTDQFFIALGPLKDIRH